MTYLLITIGFIYLFFLPGLALSFVFLKKIDFLERLIVSFALSLTVISLLVFYFNFMGMAITLLNVVMVIGLVTAVCVLIISKLWITKS